ncbi:phage antirepressor N-terminal domain-containing protein [Enterobacter cloacae]|uniref:phage antirepressor N-terminal domain-containing protein n=1 Tax=Enterobacter cloacae TaxID=550 RepID=UPI000695BBC0|nr:phage antirepressor N-terminal domain-containing protein [Enterobacter cloacae]
MKSIHVNFHGTELFIIEHNGEPYTPMKPIVEGMGLDWKSQLVKFNKRFNSTMVEITMVAADDKSRGMICLPLRKLVAWLNSISANKVKPELRNRLLQCQEGIA